MILKKTLFFICFFYWSFNIPAQEQGQTEITRKIKDLSHKFSDLTIETKNIKLNRSIEKKQNEKISIFILGDSGVGKTRFVNQFLNNSKDPIATIGLRYSRTDRIIFEKNIAITLLETNENFFSLFKNHAQNIDGFIILASAYDYISLERVSKWEERIAHTKKPSLVVYDVPGNTSFERNTTSQYPTPLSNLLMFYIDLQKNLYCKAAIDSLILKILKQRGSSSKKDLERKVLTRN